ncbi:MAG: sugar nucleotide-binding protein, partial [Proteiniphilum sp.]|nr:sugar nucleotide-binding protein [Proteiniphilum sp.]
DAEENGWKNGIFHFSNRGETTWFRFAEEIKRQAGVERCRLVPIRTDEYPAAAKRPPYSVMDLSKISHTFQVTIPAWEEALQRCIRKIQQTKS